MSRNIYKNNILKFNNYMENKERRDDEKSELYMDDYIPKCPMSCDDCSHLEDTCEFIDEDIFFNNKRCRTTPKKN